MRSSAQMGGGLNNEAVCDAHSVPCLFVHCLSAPLTHQFSSMLPCSSHATSSVHQMGVTPQCGTIRLKLLKIGVRIRVSVRAVRLSFDEGFPEAGLFGQVLARLQSLPLRC